VADGKPVRCGASSGLNKIDALHFNVRTAHDQSPVRGFGAAKIGLPQKYFAVEAETRC